ncbi:Citrate synthase [Mycena indigotica]|uniref:Citrate synthase n=1 Tax=Mycena indigotica TaxID=2126181 RepID=A0A8H6T8G9_9AGAR|nr:Citrate synthase [Mycena indigotica]KAF7312277.1 Citrate synthase [Mycena indigotica]
MSSLLNSETAAVSIFNAVAQRIPSRIALAGKLLTEHRQSTIHELTVENILHGLRGTPCLLWEISETSPLGIKYHGKTVTELNALLPKWPMSTQISPEAMLWFLYTAEIPTPTQLKHFSNDLISRAELPLDAQTFCDGLSTDIPADTQIIMTLSFLSRYSKFTAAVTKGAHKNDLWKYVLEDALDITARFPMILSRIYANVHGLPHQPWSIDLDLAANYARHIGREHDTDYTEFTRMCWSLYMDHGTSVSAHAMRLVSSAWTDPYLTVASGYIAGTGPLHAKAIGDSVMFNLALISALGPNATKEDIATHVGQHLLGGKIVPGFGHALLRVPDARLVALTNFLETHPSSDPKVDDFLNLIQSINSVVPPLLREKVQGMRNPHPNADALSGSILHAYGVPVDFMLSFFACSRAPGFLVQQVWDRALGLSMERPLSLTMDELLAKAETKTANATTNGVNGHTNGVATANAH